MTSDASIRVGFVGAGRMGRPMVRRLLAGGHKVCVLGRTVEARRALTADGAQVASDIGDVGAEADAVVVCVFSDEQVRAVCLDTDLTDGMPDGSVLVVHTTGSPRTVEAIAERVAGRGIAVVDAPVSGGPPDVDAGRLTLFVGGEEAAFARVRPLLETYGNPVMLAGPLGAGQLVKLINNALFAANLGLLADAARLGTRLGLDESMLLGALGHGSAQSRALAGAASRGSVAAFTTSVADFLAKDLDVVRGVVSELGGELGALDAALLALPTTTEK